MEKSEKELIEEANSIIRSFKCIAERKGVNTNWIALQKNINTILNEQHEYMYPTIKQIRKKKLNNLNGKN